MSEVLYLGKAKSVHSTDKLDELRLVYLDQATALNGKKKDEILGKGQLNNEISSKIFSYLTEQGINNHWIKQLSDTEQLVKSVTIIPLEVVVRNISAGSFSKRFGIKEGLKLPTPILEFYYKDDALDDPFINEDHIDYLKIASKEDIALIKEQALKINNILIDLFSSIGLTLVDFKLEFGRDSSGQIILADEVTPDTCRLWDKETLASLDKDVYRKDTGDLVSVYKEVAKRLNEIKGE
ncbi:phosphoribosylaminoimidazolesuccinocarboxamide synthase [Vagococcus luciliae]|uniref:Phosphoribosylaminoimidazole-succinocarboxamide synthase n=1 Tax=Vagococcus luciliae TaxID=2920380 RepID=A0ABY5P200_9ENTE|nr:phosphoribosylaminoimidazolesuccinocarboxamide synthase [Vagococcus luciliae]UUV99849.1 Phosphoribosylaminoimidazole-succinocarboxamide synthase [Vagococcus luciliae]